MMIPALPANELTRLAALQQCKILDTDPEESFDEIARLAANFCKTPTALVTLIDKNRQWFKSRIGMDAAETPRRIAFCAHAILHSDILVVPDARVDERFIDNPLVVGEPFIQAYAGVPLITSKGYALGTLCVIDYKPRQFSTEQLENLKLLARQIIRQLELRQNLAELERTIVTRKSTPKRSKAFLGKVACGFGLVLTVLTGLSILSYQNSTALIQSVSSVVTQPVLRDQAHLLEYINELEKQQQQWLQQIQVQVFEVQIHHLVEITISFGIFCLIFYAIYQEGKSRCQTEEALEQERDFISAVLDTVGALVIVLDAEGRIVRFNRNCERVTGYPLAEVWHRHLWDVFLLPQEVNSVRTAFADLQAGNFPSHYRNYWLTRTGDSRLIDWSNTALVNAQGDVEYVIGTGIDITDRQKAETAMQRSEATKNALLEAIPDSIIRLTGTGDCLDYLPERNSEISELNGALTNLDQCELLLSRTAGLHMQYVQRALETGKMQVYEYQDLDNTTSHIKEARVVVSAENEVLLIIRDITERKQAEQAISQLAAIVKSSNDAIVSTDLGGRVTSWNPAAEEVYGYSAEEAKGKKLIDLVTQKLSSQSEESLINLLNPEMHSKPYKTQHHTKDGQEIDVFSTISLLKDSSGNILGSSMITRDISHLRAVERMKEEFVSIVSHELRTPLSSLRGSLGLLSTGKLGTLSDKGQRMVEIAISNTDRLVHLINDILDLDRLKSRKFPIYKEICNIVEVIEQSAELMQPMLNKAGVELIVSVAPTQLYADPKCLIQVVTNLLNNAVKFSLPGHAIWLNAGIRPRDRAWDEDLNHDSRSPLLLIEIKDQGRGIPPDQLEAIFERFYQVDASDSRQKGGTGLGLTICRRIVEEHSGQIWVESVVGQGSTFFISLPLEQGNLTEF